MSLGKIAVVIPSYNYGRFVTEAVDSALAQTYPDVEVIVVDDGSTDDTRERLAGYGDRIRYLHQANRGLPGARNTGIRAASTAWVALLDADDVWHPQLLDVLAAAVERHGLDGLSAQRVKDRADLARPLSTPPVREVDVRTLLSETPLAPSGMLLRKSSVEAVGWFDESLRSVEDRDLWLRLAARFRLGAADCEGFYYRLHPGQMNRKTSRMQQNFERVLDKFFAEHPEQAALKSLGYAFMHVDAAVGYLEEGARKEGLRHLLESLRLQPYEPRSMGNLSTLTRIKLFARLLMGERTFQILQRIRQ